MPRALGRLLRGADRVRCSEAGEFPGRFDERDAASEHEHEDDRLVARAVPLVAGGRGRREPRVLAVERREPDEFLDLLGVGALGFAVDRAGDVPAGSRTAAVPAAEAMRIEKGGTTRLDRVTLGS